LLCRSARTYHEWVRRVEGIYLAFLCSLITPFRDLIGKCRQIEIGYIVKKEKISDTVRVGRNQPVQYPKCTLEKKWK